MSTYESLVFKPYGQTDGKQMLVVRTHDLCGTSYQPLFPASLQDARDIVAGTPSIDFLFGDPEPGAPVTPIQLVAIWDPKDEKARWCLYPSPGFPREIARVGDSSVNALREAGALPQYPVGGQPKFFLASDPSRGELVDGAANRSALPGMAGYNIRAALEALRHHNGGELRGPYHLQDNQGEPIAIGMPAHDRRDWEVTDYIGRCEHCGHMFFGPKRAPACKPCTEGIESQGVAPKPDPSIVARDLQGLVVGNAALRDMIDADPDDAEVEAGASWFAAGIPGQESFQARVQPWMTACFGEEISRDRSERNHRFLEEALELVQALGCSRSEAHQLVDYVYGRPEGEVDQEIGGVMVTLAALCLAAGEDMHAAGEKELARVWTKVERIRAKQAAKPKHSPLPEHVPDRGMRLTWECLSPDCCYRSEAPLFGNIRVERNGVNDLWSVNWSVPGYSATLVEGEWPDAHSAMGAAERHVHGALGGTCEPPEPERKGVYMASKAVAHGPRWQALRAAGLPVISTWIDECQPDATLDWPDLWHRCLSEVARAEVLICYLEPGETLKGAWVEVGAALALGVPVLGVGIEDFSIARSGKIVLCKTLEEAIQTARGILDGNSNLRGQDEGGDDD